MGSRVWGVDLDPLAVAAEGVGQDVRPGFRVQVEYLGFRVQGLRFRV